MAGSNFNLEDNNAILGIKSPKEHLGGPYKVVYKNIKERWAIVALKWDNEPRLGIRWFHGSGGNPFSSANPVWFIIPPTLSKNILLGLPIDHRVSSKVDEFLSGKIKGEELGEL